MIIQYTVDMTIYAAAITLIMVMDPFGNIPSFMSILGNIDPARRRVIIIREMVIALFILLLFLFFGKYILYGLHLTESALTLSGGIVLLFIAVKMIFPVPGLVNVVNSIEEPMVVPLAVPLVAGPSAMAVVILFSTRYPEQMDRWFFALLFAWAFSCVVLMFSDWLARFLGTRSIKAIERLMGMILTVLAVQMILSGIENFIHSL